MATITARKIIERALRLIGIGAEGEALSAQQCQDGLDALNDLLDSWSTDTLAVPAPVKASKALTVGAASLTIGPGGDIDSLRPVSIQRAYYRVGDYDYHVRQISADAWADFEDKATEYGEPAYFRYERTAPLGVMRLLPAVGEAGTLFIEYTGLLASFATLNTAVDLPEGYRRALQYNLAVELAPEFERDVRPSVAAIAVGSKTQLKYGNFEMPTRDNETALLGGSGRTTLSEFLAGH